ncbi:MAG: hypothetical protein U0992_06735 [Planctomycetaceae bacterium]
MFAASLLVAPFLVAPLLAITWLLAVLAAGLGIAAAALLAPCSALASDFPPPPA